MIDVTPAPSSLLKTFATLTRWSLGLVLAAWITLGLAWAALQWLIVPRIGEFRPQLEVQAAQVLGVPVRIGAIAAHSSGMIPSFELTNVELFDAQGRVALRLPRVLAAVSPRSLWHLGFEQLYVDHPELSIRRAQDGKIYVAGLDFSKNGNTGTELADWFFSQLEFAIHAGTIDWTDELRSAPPLALQQVELVVRNRARQHELRVDATPPAAWGERFSLRGQLRQPLLSTHNGRWQDWEGQLYAAFPRVDLSELRRYVDTDVDLRQGSGALTAWVDVSRAQVQAVVADIALAQVSIKLGPDLQALELQSVRGRLGGRTLAAGFEFSTHALAFDTRDGLHWPGGNISLQYLGAEGKMAARGELKADQLDLAALAQIADRLPFDASSRAALLRYAPKGLVQRIQASWQGPMGAFSQYAVKGLVTGFELAAQNVLSVAHTPANTGASKASMPTSPGIRGASIEFDFNQSSGKASISVANGALELPGVFDDTVIALTQLSTDVKWQLNGDRLAVQLPNLKFSNADAQGEAQIKWETSDPAISVGHSRFPGVLDLQGSLSRAEGTRVYRYLPAMIHRPVRDYVRDAVLAGNASAVKFKVKGDLNNMPFIDPKQGEFRISANVQNASFVYVPRNLQAPDALPWPALTQLSGELVFERAQMQVRGGHARMGTGAGLQVSQVEAVIPDLKNASVNVNAQLHGALAQALGIVNGSPLAALTGQALGRAVATASADYKLKLILPIAALDRSTVAGSVTLTGNDIQITPDTPKLTNSRGVVQFSEKGFSITGGQARMLGGEVRLEGASMAPASSSGASSTAPAVLIRASGTVSAEGLRQAKELGFVARMAQHASGSATYTAVFGLRRGMPELMVTSNLQGLGLSLPAPFNKSAEAALPFRLETALVRDSLQILPGGLLRLRDQLTLELGQVASILYMRDLSGPEPRVLSGSLGVGLLPQESAPLPAAGVAANINLSVFDLDVWGAVLSQAALTSLSPTVASSATLSYLPSSIALRARELTFGGRKLNSVVLGGAREGLLWRANLDASELNGYMEYRQPSGAEEGRVYARLARVTVAPSVASDVEALLKEQPASIPALDIVVEDFELRGKRLGRLEVEAVNRGAGAAAREGGVRGWRLNKLNVITPEAVLTASGNWGSNNAQVDNMVAASQATTEHRQMVLNFKLSIVDGGELLARLGMKDVVRKGHGKMEGQVTWMGSPFSLDYPSMTGAFTVNVENGQFLKADPGIAKLLGVLSLQALPRRLTLDFRDIFSEGFSFDFLRGDVTIEQGIAATNNLQMKGVNAAVLMEGKTDIEQETQDIKVVVVPEINAGTASLIASVINPAIGVGTFLAQLFLRRPLIEAATQEFHMDGSWADPKIVKVQRKR